MYSEVEGVPLRTVDKLWWFRYSFAIVAALISIYLTILFPASPTLPWLALMVAIILYLLTYAIVKYGFRIKPESLPKKRDLAMMGVFAYFVAWFVFWVLFYTLAVNFGIITI